MEDRRMCIVFGEMHDMSKVCLIIEEKSQRYEKILKMRNILLEYAKKMVNFYQLLCEIAKLNKGNYDWLSRENHQRIVPLEGMIEYFAVSLDCSNMKFIKDSGRIYWEDELRKK